MATTTWKDTVIAQRRARDVPAAAGGEARW